MVRLLSSAALLALTVISVVPQPRSIAVKNRPDPTVDVGYPQHPREKPGAAIAWFHREGGRATELSGPSLARASRIARASGNLLLERIYLEHARSAGRPEFPISAEAALRLAQNSMERGDPSTALRLVSAPGPADGPAGRQATLTLAHAYSQMSRRQEARRLFTGLIADDPSPQAPDDRSYAAVKALDEMDGADATLTSAEHRRRAEIYQFYRDIIPARLHFEALAAAEPASEPGAIMNIARGYVLAGDHGQAAKLYERLLERFPDSPEAKDALLRLAGAYSRVGKAREAAARYQSFIDKYPADEQLDRAYLNQVDILRDEGDTTSAAKWCDRAEAIFPGKPAEAAAQFAKVRIHITRDEWPEALSAIDSLSRLKDLGNVAIPGGTNRDEVAFLRGMVLEKLGRFPDAVEAYLSVPDGRNEYYGWLATGRLRAMALAPVSAKAVAERIDILFPDLDAKDRLQRRAAAIQLLRLAPSGEKHDKAAAVFKTTAKFAEALNFKSKEVKRPAFDALLRAGAFEDAAAVLDSTTALPADVDVLIKGNRADLALRVLEPIWNKVPPEVPVHALPRDRLRQLYPVAFHGRVVAAAKKDGVDPRLILSIMRQESRFDTAARSNAGARGLMQFVSTTAVEVERSVGVPGFEQTDLYDPEIAIMFGARHLADLYRKFPGQTEAVVAAYNAGEDNMSRWLARARSNDPSRYVSEIMFTQTKDYVYRVMANLRMYQTLYDEELRPVDAPASTAN